MMPRIFNEIILASRTVSKCHEIAGRVKEKTGHIIKAEQVDADHVTENIALIQKHHPDLGGETDTFRKIHQAYLDLVQWAENPSYMKRRGFPDKWFYDGNKNKWVQPTPYRTVS